MVVHQQQQQQEAGWQRAQHPPTHPRRHKPAALLPRKSVCVAARAPRCPLTHPPTPLPRHAPPPGTGKTAIVRDTLRSLDSDAVLAYTVTLNSQHDGPSLQTALEAPLEKKAGE